ncbi:MAG: tRNA pseudouridine(38-40) synthase TruA [Nitrospinota bacterium]|nr:tRNA pseudouridine(38-40) synthase TruA [Nitrospinota bacterium]
MTEDTENNAQIDPLEKPRNLKMIVEYDGTEYSGWQTQEDKTGGPTLQQVLERCLSRLAVKNVRINCAGRTDAGVHALGQVFNVIAAFRYDNNRLLHSLNSMLPRDIAIKSIEEMENGFHPRRDALWKRYRYQIYTNPVPSPHLARTSWWMPVSMDVALMNEAAKKIVGEHNFRSFMARGSTAKSFVRSVISCNLSRSENGMITLEIVGEGFLKYMVRIIAGTLVEVGRGRFRVEDMEKIIEARDRRKAGPTAPPRGLFLVEVGYRPFGETQS